MGTVVVFLKSIDLLVQGAEQMENRRMRGFTSGQCLFRRSTSLALTNSRPWSPRPATLLRVAPAPLGWKPRQLPIVVPTRRPWLRAQFSVSLSTPQNHGVSSYHVLRTAGLLPVTNSSRLRRTQGASKKAAFNGCLFAFVCRNRSECSSFEGLRPQ